MRFHLRQAPLNLSVRHAPSQYYPRYKREKHAYDVKKKAAERAAQDPDSDASDPPSDADD